MDPGGFLFAEEFVYEVYLPVQFFGLLIQLDVQKVALLGLREPLTVRLETSYTGGVILYTSVTNTYRGLTNSRTC